MASQLNYSSEYQVSCTFPAWEEDYAKSLSKESVVVTKAASWHQVN